MKFQHRKKEKEFKISFKKRVDADDCNIIRAIKETSETTITTVTDLCLNDRKKSFVKIKCTRQECMRFIFDFTDRLGDFVREVSFK